MIPKKMYKYFWDVKPKEISPKKDKKFIIERLLEYGDLEEMRWIQKNFNIDDIKEVLITSRKISPKTGVFFSLYFSLPKEQLECIKNPFIQKQNRF